MTHSDAVCVIVISEPAQMKTKKTVVTIDSGLHGLLKDLAKKRGMLLHALVETKLRELVEPRQLELVEAGQK